MEHGDASLGRARTFYSNLTLYARWTGVVPARAHNPDDVGSIPTLATNFSKKVKLKI